MSELPGDWAEIRPGWIQSSRTMCALVKNDVVFETETQRIAVPIEVVLRTLASRPKND